jgi:hypothetical protein
VVRERVTGLWGSGRGYEPWNAVTRRSQREQSRLPETLQEGAALQSHFIVLMCRAVREHVCVCACVCTCVCLYVEASLLAILCTVATGIEA